MNSTWVLIIWLLGPSGAAALATHEFKSKDACLVALGYYQENSGSLLVNAVGFCTENR